MMILILLVCLVGAEDDKWDIKNAECKNNDGKTVPCQTSEEHINILTRALTRSSRSSLEQHLAPNSASAYVEKWGFDDLLGYYSKSFEELDPTLTFGRWGKSDATIDGDDIFYNKFSEVFKSPKLKNILDGAEKIVFLAHGYNAGDSINGCSSEWQAKMAKDIQKVEGEKAVTVVFCWNSSLIESWFGSKVESLWSGITGLFGRSGLQSRDLISGFSGLCQSDYEVWGSYYYSATSTAKLGELLGGMMKVIKQETSINYFHGIGHSLGAHIMGNVWNFGEFKMNRISGLDPAGPCFDGNTGDIIISGGTDWGLHKNAAYFVDSYHTNGDGFGTTISKGHLNLFAGNPEDKGNGYGAAVQPTCSASITYTSSYMCSHSMSYKYYARTIDIGRGEYKKFSTYYKMRCEKRDNGYLTDECRKIGPIDASEYTYVGYHADVSGWEEGNRFDVNLYLPIAKAGYGVDDWKGPCEWNWNYCSH